MEVPLRVYPREFKLDRLTVARHLARYAKGIQMIPEDHPHYADQSHWLDFGCGSGYGTAFLANFTRRVDGYDSDREVIAYAIDLGSPPGVRFLDRMVSCVNYEVIFMVEVAEHMLRHEFEALLCSLSAEHLSSGSMIYITTPIVDVTGPSASNAHHKCEYSIEDFRRIIEGANLRITASDFQLVKSTAGDMRQGFFVLEN